MKWKRRSLRVVELADDVVANILLKLPMKSLIRFRSVCKTWCDLIKSPSFIAEYSRQKRNDPILYMRFGLKGCFLSSFSTESINTYTDNFWPDLVIPSTDRGLEMGLTCFFLGPCNGIVGIVDFWTEATVLCNPSLREFKVLPSPLPPPPPPPPRLGSPVRMRALRAYVGFGFDPLTDDYKVIRIAGYNCKFVDEDDPRTIRRAEIYNLSSDSWREIDYSLPFTPCCDRAGTLFEGACHWCGEYESRDVIVSFHMSEEVFRVIGWGPIQESKSAKWRSLVVLDGCLGVVMDYNDTGVGSFEIWVMKEYGVESSWTKQFRFSILRESINRVLHYHFCLWNEGELILKVANRERATFNMHTRHLQTYFCAHAPHMVVAGTNKSLIYKGSLVSLNYRT